MRKIALALALVLSVPSILLAATNDCGFEDASKWTGGTIDKTVFRSGKQSLKLTQGQASSSNFEIDAGSYYFSFHIKGSGINGEVFMEAKGGKVFGHTTPAPEGTYNWSKVFGVLNAETKTAAAVKIQMQGKGTAWIDDIELVKFEPSTVGQQAHKDGPYHHFVTLARSRDTLNWTTDWQPVIKHASVPHGIFFKNEHFVYYVNGLCHKLYVGHGKDPKNLTFAPVMLDGKETFDSVDPDVVDLGNGKLRIYFLSNFMTGGNIIKSATTTDGINFISDPGARYQNKSGGFATDPDVVKIGDKWFMYLAKGETNFGVSSPDGMGFSGEFEVGKGSVSDTINVGGATRQFYHENGIASRTTKDGKTFVREGMRLGSPRGFFVGDPNIYKAGNEYFMYAKIFLIKFQPAINPPPPGGGNPPPEHDYPPGTEKGAVFGAAEDKHYLKVNSDSDFRPPKGGVAKNPGPATFRLMAAKSRDGLKFDRSAKIVCDRGAVPDLTIDKNGWIYLYYTAWTVGSETNKTVAAISKDNGESWTFKKLNLERRQGESDLVDPDIIIADDGTFRLFTTIATDRQGYAKTHYHESRDGIKFERKGVAFDPGKEILDPSAAKIGNTCHIFGGGGGGPNQNWHGISNDGKTFKLDGFLKLEKNGIGQMMANGISDAGGCRFYCFGNDRKNGISSFFTTDGKNWKEDAGWRLGIDASSKLENGPPHDPAVVKLSDGTYLMIYVAQIKAKQ